MKYATILCAGLLAGCSATGTSALNRIVAQGDLFCSVLSASGPQTVAALDASGVPLNVINRSASVVAAWCAVLKGIPVVPPSNPGQAPAVAAPIVVAPVGKPTP